MGPIAWACSNQALHWCCWINDLPAIEIKLSPYDENLFKENNQLLISELIISGPFYPKEVIFLTGWDWLIFLDEFTFFPLQCLPHHYWRASSRSHLYYGTAQKISSYQGTHFTGEVVASTGWWNPLSPPTYHIMRSLPERAKEWHLVSLAEEPVEKWRPQKIGSVFQDRICTLSQWLIWCCVPKRYDTWV